MQEYPAVREVRRLQLIERTYLEFLVANEFCFGVGVVDDRLLFQHGQQLLLLCIDSTGSLLIQQLGKVTLRGNQKSIIITVTLSFMNFKIP